VVECEHDDDIYGHSYDEHDYGMSPGTGQLLQQVASAVGLSVSLTVSRVFSAFWQLLA